MNIRELIDWLNERTKEYDIGNPTISDKEWDDKYFELEKLEKETGIIYPDSPTQTIYYDVIDSFEKINHDPPMLSLAKTKDINEVKDFIKDKDYIISLKMDGLSCRLEYDNGELVSASTRGTGEVGDLVTSNVRTCKNVPKHIPYLNHLVIDGEIIITVKDFESFSQDYKNPRNLAAGSLKLLDSGECAKRNLSFIAWDVINQGPRLLSSRLNGLSEWGFTVVPFIEDDFDKAYAELPKTAEELGYPIDGLVIKYDEVKYYRSLGTTSHHPNGGLALKFYDETYETTLLDIVYDVGRTGQLTPVATFQPVEIDGCSVSRASLANETVLYEKLRNPWRGQKIWVSKRNQIIPWIEEADTETRPDDDAKYISSLSACPICGGKVFIKSDSDREILFCNNPDCEGKLVNRITHFCGKSGLDIKGLSKQTIDKLINWNWITSAKDIFELAKWRGNWIKQTGFGIKSVDNILNAIETSRQCDLDKFIAALGIPLIGTSASKALASHFGTWEAFIEAVNSDFKFYTLPDFGPEAHSAIMNFDFTEANDIYTKYLTINEVSSTSGDSSLEGLTFVITGKVGLLAKNRDELKSKIEARGGKITGSVSKNTNYLINNEIGSTSTKNETAKKLGVPIITEENFIKIFGEIN